jgi:RNA polymerase sigma-70 factor (ECF subfamily)
LAYTKIVELLVEISQPQTDESLATRTQDGDREAFGLLVERYEEKLSRYGRKFIRVDEDIEDVVQEVFIKAYRNIRSFNTSQRFSPWIYRIAHNAFVNELRRKSRNPFFAMDFDSLISHPQSPDTAELPAQNREMKELVEKGLGALPANYREVLLLFYEEELSYKEIADVLQVPIGTVGVRVKRAKEALAKAYATMNIKYDF